MKRLSDEDLNHLKTPGKDFLVDTDLWDAPMAIEMARVAMADDDVRVWLGTVGDARLLRLWHCRGRDGELALDANLLSDSFIVTEDLREKGSETFERHLAKEGRLVLPVDHRYRKFDIRGVPAETLQKAMESAGLTDPVQAGRRRVHLPYLSPRGPRHSRDESAAGCDVSL